METLTDAAEAGELAGANWEAAGCAPVCAAGGATTGACCFALGVNAPVAASEETALEGAALIAEEVPRLPSITAFLASA